MYSSHLTRDGTAHTIQSHYDACSELSNVLELQLMSYTHSCDRLLGELTYCMSPGEQILGGGLEPLGPHEVGAYVDTSFYGFIAGVVVTFAGRRACISSTGERHDDD